MSATGIPFNCAAFAANGVLFTNCKIWGWVPTSLGAKTSTPIVFYSDPALTTPATQGGTYGDTSGRRVIYYSPSTPIVLEVKSTDEATALADYYFPAVIATVDTDWLSYLAQEPTDVIRIKLTADTTFYVNHSTAVTDINGDVWAAGSNSNTGLSRSSPLATITYAYKLIRDRYDCNGKKVVIQCVPRTFDEYVVCHGECVGLQASVSGSGLSPETSAGVIIRGNLSSEAACFNSRSDAFPCFSFAHGARVRLEGIKYQNTAATDNLLKVYAGARVDLAQVVVGTGVAGTAQMQAADGGTIVSTDSADADGWVKFDGNAGIGIVVEVGTGVVDLTDVRFGASVTYSGHPSSSFANIGEGAYFSANIAWTGSFQGRKYWVAENAVLSDAGVTDIELIPGSQPGVRVSSTVSRPGTRLTLTDGTPVTTSDVTAATVVHLEPLHDRYVLVRNGVSSGLMRQTIPATGISLTLDATNYLSGSNYDLFSYALNDGTVVLATTAAWTNDTTRSVGISRVDGTWVNTGSTTLRYNTGGGSTTVSAAAATAAYLGTIRCTANGQTEDSVSRRHLFNNFNRTSRDIRVAVGTDTWSGSGAATWRYFNADAANRAEFTLGLLEDAFEAAATMEATNSTSTIRVIRVGVGVNSNSAIATGCLPQMIGVDNTTYKGATSIFRGMGQLGFNYVAPLELDNASDTRTFRGDAGSPTTCQTGLVGTVMA